MHTLLRVIVGSRAYGLDNELSDTDYATVFAYPTDALLSLQMPDGTEQPPNLVGEGQDSGVWEVKKFMQMALSGNPTVLETLWTDTVVEASPFGESLRALRHYFLSRKVIGAYGGYATQQAQKLERKYLAEGEMTYAMWKHLAHMCRLMIAGTHAVRTGEILVRLPEEDRNTVLRIKRGLCERSWAMRRFEKYRTTFELAVPTTVLPAKPDIAQINRLLLDIRHAF